jgi:uncharacterized protein (DUF58 family)
MGTLFRLLRAAFHTGLLFLLPWILGVAAGAVFDIREVTDTGSSFFFYFMLVSMPLLFMQVLSIGVRVRREVRMQKALGKGGFGMWATALDRHARLLTGRGIGLVLGASIALMCALGVKWGQFAIMAVAGMGLLYLTVTAAAVASAFSILSFDERSPRKRGRIERRMTPALAGVGDPVEEEFTLGRVPIPPLYRLHIAEVLPERLGGETRFALERNASTEEVTVRAPLMQTLRGVYLFGPAEIAYEDVFGLTRIAVASLAQVDLRVLPQMRSIVYANKPKALSEGDGSLSRPHRFPTDDYFRLREYQRGDDARRVHWKRSIQLGAMHVRLPESIPYKPKDVLLVLDTYLPPGLKPAEGALADALDLLVEGWVSLARALSQQGERVTLAAAVIQDGKAVVRRMQAKRGEGARWRSFGADVAWQSMLAPEAVARDLQALGTSAIWITSALAPVPSPGGPESSIVWVDPRKPPVTRQNRSAWRRFFAYPFPAGSDDNRINLRALFSPKAGPFLCAQLVEQHLQYGVSYTRSQQGVKLLHLRRAGAALSLGDA